MSAIAVLFSILGTILIGAISPGPSFVLVSRTAVTISRTDGLAAALGMGLGGAIFGTLALAGLTALLLQVDWLYFVLKIVGGTYLAYLGFRIWQGAADPIVIPETTELRSRSWLRSFTLALATQLSNPKAAIVYASIFAALMPESPPAWLLIALPPLLFLVEATWYAVVALAFSAKGPRSVYLGAKAWIDRAAGAVMGILGTRLIFESVRSRV
ncbi:MULTISPECIES: LysE family translocator [unclassified Sinorhizobium]|uniref:LysE family translocator n=1 Tax=unclassified Sinorhizobium TaxID=2613772 RepID=UPI0035263619